MAGTTPQLSNKNAIHGTQFHLRNDIRLHHHHRQSKIHHVTTTNTNITSSKLRHHQPNHPHQQPQSHNVQTIPIRLLIDNGSVSRATSVPLVTKVGVTLSTPTNNPSPRPSPNLSKAHPPLTRLHTGYRPPRPPRLSSHPDSPRIVHAKRTLPEKPPPYEQIFDVSTDEESEPIECPSVLAGSGPRKEKKRSLRSRLLRHITGQKAAAQAARRASMAGSCKGRTPAGSPQVRPRGGCTQLIIQPTTTPDGNVQIVQNCPTQLQPQIIPVESRLVNTQNHNHQLSNGVTYDHSRLHSTPSNSSAGISQVILLHTVPEEESIESSSSVNTSSHTVLNISTTSEHSSMSPPITQTNASSGASQPPSSSSHSSSVFIHSHSSEQPCRNKDEHTVRSNPNNGEVPIKVPQAQSVDSSILTHKKTQVTSNKSSNGNVYFFHSQCSSTSEEKKTNSMSDPTSNVPQQPKRNIRKKEKKPDVNKKVKDPAPNNSYTINLKPGMYKLNLNFANKKKGSKTETINITVPATDKQQNNAQYYMGKPPPIPEPLFYESSSKVSLPQRFAHLLKPSSLGAARTQSSRNAPKVTIIQKSPDSKGSQVITVLTPGENDQQASPTNGHRRGIGGCPTRSHKKERYRWASFPCVHMSSTSGLEETVSEASGCDSWQGYEGVEHLKRQSECQKIVPYTCNAREAMSCEVCEKQSYYKGKLDNYNYYSDKDATCDGSQTNCVICSKFNKFNSDDLYTLPQLKQSVKTVSESDPIIHPNLKKNWLEDEVFLRKVVDEYFMDPISSSEDNCDTILEGDSSSTNSGKSSTINEDEENSMVDSKIVTRRSEESQIIPIEKCNDSLVALENSFDDSFYCDTDETLSSLFSDDSMGYDGDVEEIEHGMKYNKFRDYLVDSYSNAVRCSNLLKADQMFLSRHNDNSVSPSNVTAADASLRNGNSASLDSLKNLGNASTVHPAENTNSQSLLAEQNRRRRFSRELARETEIGTEGGGEVSEGESAGVATPAIDTTGGGGGDDEEWSPVAGASSALLCDQQCHFGCRGEGGTRTPQPLFDTKEAPSAKNLNLAITKVKPLKLQTFADSVYSLKSSVTDSCDSLCSRCRNETLRSEAGNITDSIENDLIVKYNLNEEIELPSAKTVTNEVLKCGLVFERSNIPSESQKFDLKSALQSLQQLECNDSSFSQSILSDSVYAPNSSFELNSSYRSEEEDMANIDLKVNISQSYYNSKFLYQSNGSNNSAGSNNTSYANIDDGDSVNNRSVVGSAPRVKMRRPPKPPKHTKVEDNKYETYDFGTSSHSECDDKRRQSYSYSSKFKDRPPGLVTISSGSSTEDGNINRIDEVPCFKPGRKRFAKAFQKAVIQVPVSASQDSPSPSPIETIKSELVINPHFSGLKHISAEQSSIKKETCISEYKIGAAPSVSTTPVQLTDSKLGNCDTSSSDIESKKVNKLRKTRRSKPRKYFSGILDAIGNAAPLFRNSLVSNSTNYDEREISSDSVSTPPLTPKQADSSYSHLWDQLPQTTSATPPPRVIHSFDSLRKEMPLPAEVTLNKIVTSPLLTAAYENNIEAADAHNHWRAAYLGHVGCDSSSLISDCASECNDVTNSAHGENIDTNPHLCNKKNFEKISINGNSDNLAPAELMYENVVFHKNLKKVKVPRFDVDMNDFDDYCNKTDDKNITTTATITLNCDQLNRHNLDIAETLPANDKISTNLAKPTIPSFDSCTVTASFSMADLHYEDWCSAVGDHEDANNQDSETDLSFDKRSDSSDSLHSEASSFYYTAGANTIYEAVKSVRKSFADEYDYSENELETNTECDSSDEVTYNTTTQETKYIKTDDEFVEELTIEGSRSPSSAGSDLIEQLNELEEKYFRKTLNPDDYSSEQNSNEFSDDLMKDVNESRTSIDFQDGIVHAVPCMVLTDSDSPNDSSPTLNVLLQRVRPEEINVESTTTTCSGNTSASGDKEFFWTSQTFHNNGSFESPTQEKRAKNNKPETNLEFDEESEISEEVDKRMSGMWTSFTGGDADEESCGDNSESTNSGSKVYDYSFNENREGPSTSLPDSHPSYSFASGNEYINSSRAACGQTCLSRGYWCSPTDACQSCRHSYENTRLYQCCDDPSCRNTCDSCKAYSCSHDNIDAHKPSDLSYLPSSQPYNTFEAQSDGYGLYNDSPNEFSNSNVFNEKSGNNCTLDSDQSFSYDSNDNEDRSASEEKEVQKNVQNTGNSDFLDVPDNENTENWGRPYRDPRKDPNGSSLLDDVITCLAGKWNVSSSGTPSPSSAVHDTPIAHNNNNKIGATPVRSNSYRPSRSGKPPVSPGSRPKDGIPVRSCSSRPQSRRRSRSASAGAKLRASNYSCVARPASLVGLPRPSSLADIVPGTPAYSTSQESLHSVSLLPSSFDDLAPRPQWLAERKKAEGNEAYRNKEYRDALQHYTQAIELCPEYAAYYSNRSACYMMIGKYREALNDAQRAVTLDKTFVKGWLRVGKCHVALGDGGAAISVLRHAQELEPNNSALIQEITSAQALQKCVDECNRAVDKKDYRTAVFHLDQALRYALGGLELRIAKAEYLTFLGRVADSEDIVNEILMGDNNHADALYVRGLCRYYQDNQDAAFQHFQKVLRLVPDHNKAKETYKRAKLLIQKKEQGNAAFKMGDFAKAMEIYGEALEIDTRNKSTNSKLYCNRATVAAKLGKLEQAISDCSAALLLDEGYIKAYLRRANTYQQTEQFEEAVRDLEKVYRIQRSQEHKRLLHEAKVQLKRSKRKDYYKILGVSKTASDDEIKKAYRKMALLHHPDRHSSANAVEKSEHEKKFKELGEAYAVLTDPKKRGMHDRGQDVNDPDCGGFSREAAFDPNQVFTEFFGPDFFGSQSHHYYDQSQGGQPPPQQQQFQGQQFQGQHAGFQGFPGMSGGFQFRY